MGREPGIVRAFLPFAAEKFFDFLYPQPCYSCGKKLENHGGFYLCSSCKSGLSLLDEAVCSLCGFPGRGGRCAFCKKNKPCFDAARAYAFYEGALSKGLKQFKYGGKSYLAGTFAAMLKSCAVLHGLSERADIIAPVPLSRPRRRQRGFNQSGLIARKLGLMCGKPVSEGNLVRVKNTPPQTSLGRDSRLDNVRGIFAVKSPEKLRGRAVLLVDDVFTTGATVNECAGTLKASGSPSVDVLTVARSR